MSCKTGIRPNRKSKAYIVEEKRDVDAAKAMREHLGEILRHDQVRRMKSFIQHGKVTTYDHCKSVARTSFSINQKLHLNADEKKLLTGAMLHDFYLYDWHHKDDGEPGLHGYTHAAKAAQNAQKYFQVGEDVQAIIRSHMWPLNLTKLPASREAWIVCLADKYCSLKETLFQRK